MALDTTVVRNFHDAGYPTQLRQYLPQAVVIGDVQGELNRQARTRSNLTALMRGGWPKLLPALPKDLIERGYAIQELWLDEGDEPTAHLGEIFTVLGAHHFGVPLIITDDGDAKRLAREEEFSLPAIDTGELACEMVCQGKLHELHAWAIYRGTKKNPKRDKFDELLERAKTAPPNPFPSS